MLSKTCGPFFVSGKLSPHFSTRSSPSRYEAKQVWLVSLASGGFALLRACGAGVFVFTCIIIARTTSAQLSEHSNRLQLQLQRTAHSCSRTLVSVGRLRGRSWSRRILGRIPNLLQPVTFSAEVWRRRTIHGSRCFAVRTRSRSFRSRGGQRV